MRKAVSKILPGSSGTSSLLIPNFKLDFNSVEEFYITVDKPHQTWLPGDEVSGQIILISKKNLANVVISLSLIGVIKINPSSHSKLRSLKSTLFKHTIMIYGGENTNNIPTGDFSNGLHKGEHRFPFIVKLPIKRIFTSIDFGKGSITYNLSASITNIPSRTLPLGNTANSNLCNSINSPNSLQSISSNETSSNGSSNRQLFKSKNHIMNNASHTAEKAINLISPIDVSVLPPPKPKRLIIRDPRRQRRLSRTQSSTSTINTQSTTSSGDSTSGHSTTNDIHGASPTVAGTPLATLSSNSNSTPVNNDGTLLKCNSNLVETIKVALEIPQRGYIRGESIPVKISINHLKKVQDLNGIIVTFVRVCRLDNGTDGFLESFRKDLQQGVLPLYVDPVNLQSEINTSVRIPPDAFPTIVGCPLVSFQYFIEVLVNLSGKSVDVHSSYSHTNAPNLLDSSGDNLSGTPTEIDKFHLNTNNGRSAFINTDRFKRSKKFVQLTTEIIVGTHRLERIPDNISSRSRRSSSHSVQLPLGQPQSNSTVESNSPAEVLVPVPNPPQSFISAIPESMEASFQSPPYVPNYNDLDIAIPIPDQNNLTEKERMKAHEQALMPSAPVLEEDEDDDHVISPIHHSILEEDITPSPQRDIDADNQYQFFNERTSLGGDDNGLNTTPWPHVDTTDFVPKYEKYNNDVLVNPGSVEARSSVNDEHE
jgi:hypothetical protein